MSERTWQADRKEFLTVGSGALLAAGLFGKLATADEAAAALARLAKGTTLTIGVSGDPQTLDPEWGQAARANEVIKNIYAQWTRYGIIDSGKGYLKADLRNVVGETVNVRVGPDKKTVNLTVRKGAKFPDGRPITADDLMYKIQRSLGVNGGSVFVFNTIGLTKTSQVTKVNDREIRLKLAHPSGILGPMLRDQDAAILDPQPVKQHATKADPWAQKWLARNAAPAGAYVIDSWTPGRSLVLKANPNFFRPKPYFTTVVLQVIPSADERALLLRNGTIDIAADLSADAASRLKGASGVRVVSVPTNAQDLLGLMVDREPFNDVKVRRAVAYAIPYEALAKNVLRGEALVPKGVWPRGSIWFQNAPWPYKYDPARAKALLAEAGHESGLQFTCEISDADADAQALAVPVQTALRQVGVTMEIRKIAAAEFSQHLVKRSMQSWIQSGLGSYVDDPYYHVFLWYATGAVINWFKYSNKAVDKANEQLKVTLDPATKRRLARTVQQQLNNDLPAISLGEPNFLLPMRTDITGYLYEPDGLLTYRLLRRK